MADSITTEYNYFDLDTCNSPSSQGWWTIRTTKTIPNYTQRIRPPEPLFLSPTSIPKLITSIKAQGLRKWISSCYPYYGETGIGMKEFDPVGSLPPNELTTDWALELRLKIKDEKVNLGTALVEADKTYDMFNSFRKGIKGAWDLYRGRLPKKLRRKIRPCDIPASYLATTYGLEPLIGDLMDSIEVLKRELPKPIYQRYSVTCKAKEETGDPLGSYTLKERSDRAVVYLKAYPGESDFTLGNIGELAWEVIPFSFVVDWGIGVQDWLSSLNALSGTEFVSGTLTTKTRTKVLTPYSDPSQRVHSARLEELTHERVPLVDIPIPPRPRIGFGPSYRRLTNAIALLWAVNDRCKR